MVKTISEVILEESVVVRVGCLAGPNLSKELSEGHPAATVIASHFNEVINIGKRLLRNENFQVYGNNDVVGVELGGGPEKHHCHRCGSIERNGFW